MNTVTNPHQAPAFDCPNCAVELPAGSTGCHACGIRLTGPLALRLWHVGQEIGRLGRERDALRTRLLAPPDAEEQWLSGAPLPAVDPALLQHRGPGPAVPPGQTQPQMAGAGWSGQQVLLGIGALLLLSGAAFFIAVVWSLIGVGGQALVMLTLTGLAAAGAALATRQGLPAAAETSAVIATGLVWLDLSAAHALGLFGLDRLEGSTYWSGAAVLGAVVIAGFDAVLPRTVDGAPARRMFIYRPAVTVLVCVALWNLLAFGTDARGTSAAVLALVLAVLSVGVAIGAYVLDPPRSGSLRPSMVAPVVSAAIAYMIHLVLAVAAGWTPGSAVERYGAMALLLVVPVTALAGTVWGPVNAWLEGRPQVRPRVYVAAAVGLFLAAGVPLMEAPREVLAVVSLVLGAGAGVLLRRPLTGVDVRAVAATWLLSVVLVVLGVVWVLDGAGASSGLALWAGDRFAGPAAVWVAALPAFGFALAAGVPALWQRSVQWTVVAQIAAYVGLAALLADSTAVTVLVVTLFGALLHVGLAAVALQVGRAAGRVSAHGFEVLAGIGAGLFAVVAVESATGINPLVHASAWLLLGGAVLAYAGLPGRLWTAYVGAVLVPVGVGVLLDRAGVETVEAYTASAVVILAAVGVVQWVRTPGVATMIAMGPALVVGVLPTLFIGIDGDELVRLVAVTALGLVLLVVGLVRRWQAPVLVGLFVLGAVAWTQGGRLVEYVPNFILLMGAGAVALALGVAWEVAVRTGRRGVVWFSGLR